LSSFILINLTIFVVNILLFINAKKTVTFLNHGEENKKKTMIFKTFNIILFVTHMLDLTFQEYATNIINVGYAIVYIYVGVIAYEVMSYYSRKKAGTKRETKKEEIIKDKDGNEETVTTKIFTYDENYNTRINNIFIFVFVSALVVLNLLKLWGMESALEQKGIIGVILAALLFTSAHWLPNILKGLTLMNSNRVSKNDVIRMNHRFYIVFDMSLQYTRLLDVESNKRVLLENKQFSESKISNLSKKASMDGYRDYIEYNVGYPSLDIKDEVAYDKHINKWKSIFEEIFETIEEDKNLKVKNKYELFMVETGDYAIKWRFSFYYEDFGKLNSTGAIRRVLSSKFRLNEMIQKKAHLRGISLATPTLEQQVH